MSAQPVDVLAVMQAAIDHANAKASGPTRRVPMDLHKAVALADAVRELIAADTEYDVAKSLIRTAFGDRKSVV